MFAGSRQRQGAHRVGLWCALALLAVAGCKGTGTFTTVKDGGSCATDADCNESLFCLEGRCVEHGGACVSTFECPPGLECTSGLCLPAVGSTDGGAGSDGGDPPTPMIEVNPSLLDFGAVPMGQSAALGFTVSSTGDVSLRIFEVRRDVSTTFEFDAVLVDALGDPLPLPLDVPAGGDVEATVTYRPIDGVADLGTIEVVSDAPGPVARVQVQSGYEGLFDIVVAPVRIDFGFVSPGSSATEQITVTNQGDTSSVLTLTEVRTEPVSSQAYSYSAPTAMPIFLFGGDSVQLDVTYSPPASPLGVHDEALVIASTDPDEPTVSIPLYGFSLPLAQLMVTPDQIDFGPVQVGFPQGRTISLVNTGGQSLEIRGVSFSMDGGGQFAVASPVLPYSLNPSGSVDLTVTFDPAVTGLQGSSGVDIVHEDPDDAAQDLTVNVPVVGTGTSPLATVIPLSLDFGQVYRQSPATTLQLRVTNAGVGPLQVTRIQLGAGTTSEFTLGAVSLPAILSSGQELVVDADYLPSAIGADLGVLEVDTSDQNNLLLQVTLSGEGVGCSTGTADIDGDPLNGCECFAIPANGNTCSYLNGTTGCDANNYCYLESCDANYWNLDGDPASGCEYYCVNSGLEVCDGADNDCDGLTDPMTATDVNNCGSCGNQCTNSNGTTQCLGGTCVPSCAPNYGDCDPDPDNGCEASLTTLASCGACNNPCSVTNGTPDCSTGTCQVSDCDAGWCDENNSPGDGCEVDLDVNPSCAGYTSLGTVRGDIGGDTTSTNSFGEQWFRIYVSEANSSLSCIYLSAVVTLAVPAGTDYDLYTYCDDCTTSAAWSINVGDDLVELRWNEDCIVGIPTGSDSGRYIYIQVRYWNADICDTYTLTVWGNPAVSSSTCSSR